MSDTLEIALVVAAAANNVIGRDGAMPWHLRDDLKHFKSLTMGHPVIMGRATFESIGKPLPERHNIVLSRQADYCVEGTTVVASPAAALAAAGDVDEVMVIGGGEVYSLFLPMARRVYLTRVHAEFDGDTFFPDLEASDWDIVHRESHAADDNNDHDFTFLTLERRRDLAADTR